MRPISKSALARRTAKSKATREAKQKVALEELGITVQKTKIKKPRKPMTAEQKVAAAEALKKAREAKGPSKNLYYSDVVRNLPEDDPFSLKNVQQWIKAQKEILSSMKEWKDSKEADERNRYNIVSVYIDNMESYLRHGVWIDHKAGAHMEKNIKIRCVKMAYYPDGTPKRTKGVWYPDIGVYEDNDGETLSKQKSFHKNDRTQRTRQKS
jgi:hypothetical protein